jgi:hypothetical protein
MNGGDSAMSGKLRMRKVLLLMFGCLISGLLGATASWAEQSKSFHVLFTGEVTAHLEPSG